MYSVDKKHIQEGKTGPLNVEKEDILCFHELGVFFCELETFPWALKTFFSSPKAQNLSISQNSDSDLHPNSVNPGPQHCKGKTGPLKMEKRKILCFDELGVLPRLFL